MKNKIYNILFLLIFIIIFSIFYSREYINFHKEKQKIENEKIELDKKVGEFSFEKIDILKSTDIFYTPDIKVLDKIVSGIINAKNKVYIEVYMLTETRILDAIKKANGKDIDIKIVLEKNPYKATNINNKAYNFLVKNKIPVVWSNPDNYSLNHSKIILIDEQAIISTGNFTYSSFKYNRELFIFTQDKNIISNLEKIFLNDYFFRKNIVYNNNLVLSPNYSREKIEYLINNAKENINMYFPYIQDKNLEKLLIKKTKSGVKINLIVDKNILENESYDNLIKSGIKIKKIPKNKLHAKAILIDNKYLYIGSINFSSYSLDKNREVGILIKNKDIVGKFSEIFEEDFK